MKQWMLGALVICAAACGPKTTPTGPGGGGPAQVCRKVPLTGNAVLGVTLVHAATFKMLINRKNSFFHILQKFFFFYAHYIICTLLWLMLCNR